MVSYEFYECREEVSPLIQKYIHFRPHILEKVAQFEQAHFNGAFVIGVHRRGTDAPWSSPPYDQFVEKINEIIGSVGGDYKIFVATDEEPFIDYMEAAFPGHVCCQADAYRSTKGGTPLHISPFQKPL